MRRCDIIIPVWNEPDTTRECIESILRTTAYPYRLIIIDNGSLGETENYLKSLKNVKGPDLFLIRNEKNLGFVKAANQGIMASDAPYVCLMNNDTIATDGWLNEMAEAADAQPGTGLINPSSNTSGAFSGPGESIDAYALRLKRYKGETQELSTVRGFCMLIKREVIERIGLLDEAYSIGYFEETDYSRRARAAGYSIVRVKSSYVYHKGSASFKKIEGSGALFKKNESIFYERWGRPVKIGLFLDIVVSGEKIDRLARDMVKDGHQVWIFLRKGLPWPVTLDHYEIRRVDLKRYFFELISIYQVLKRKKKKKIDIILTGNRLLGSILELTKPLHGSDVIVNASDAEAAEAVKRKTKIY